MANKEDLEQTGTSIFNSLENLLKKIKPAYVACVILPLILIYPKPLMYILKPIIRKWSFYYRTINKVASKPTEIILTSDPHLCFQKQYIKNFTLIKGTLPQAFKLISQALLDEQQLRQNEDESMKHVLIKKKHEFQKQRIFESCYVIDMQDTYMNFQKSNLTLSTNLYERKKSHAQFAKDNQKSVQSSIFSQIDYIWVEMILMKLKLLQLQNNCEAIKHVIIKANQRVLQLLQAKILGIKQSEAFKLGMVSQNRIHLLKFNKVLDTYEHCSATFKIQQKNTLDED